MQFSKESICKMFNCSMDQLNAQYLANAKQLEAMRDKAILTGKKVNKYTAEQLTEMAEKYNKLALS